MLRRFAASQSCAQRSIMLGVMGSTTTVTATQSLRSVFVFSEQSESLVKAQNDRQYKSNVWVEAEDDYWFKKFTAVKEGEKPAETSIERRLDLYNLDQLDKAPTVEGKTEGPTSARTGKPYGGQMKAELEKVGKEKGFTSHWWITEKEIAKHGASIKPGERATATFFSTRSKLFNAEQFEDSDAIQKFPVSGGSRKPYYSGSDMATTIKANVSEKGYKTGLYYSQKQLASLGLELKEGATGCNIGAANRKSPVQLATTSGVAKFYNVDDVEESEKLLDELQRFPTDEHMDLVSGTVLRGEARKAAISVEDKYNSKYWVSSTDLDRLGKKVNAKKAVPLPLKAFGTTETVSSSGGVVVFNVEELADPASGFKAAGKYVA